MELLAIPGASVMYPAGMILVIDNYDSFTFNLVQYLGELNVEMQVHRNDQITLEKIEELKPERILISPGPCSPNEAKMSPEMSFSRTLIVDLIASLSDQSIGLYTSGSSSSQVPASSLSLLKKQMPQKVQSLQILGITWSRM